MPRGQAPTGAVLDLGAKFQPSLIGAGLARLWSADGIRLVPTVDHRGDVARCPITLEPFVDPVLLVDGFVYERDAILEWLRHHDNAPCTNNALPRKTALRLEPLRDTIDNFLASGAGVGSSRLAQLRQALLEARKLERVHLEPCGSFEALRTLEACMTEASADIREWQATVDSARDVAKSLRLRLSTWATSHVQAVMRSFQARSRLASMEFAQDLRHRAAAREIQRFWRVSQQRLARPRCSPPAHHLLDQCALDVQASVAKAKTAKRNKRRNDKRREKAWSIKIGSSPQVSAPVCLPGDCLFEAIRGEEWERCLAILAQDDFAEVNAKRRDGTALHYAAGVGNAEICDAILTRVDFTEVSAREECGNTALHYAADNGLVDVCRTILSRMDFTEVNAKDRDGSTALHGAALIGNAEICEAILKRLDFTEVNATDLAGQTALHYVAVSGSADSCRAILACTNFAQVNAKTVLGSTALHLAAKRGHTEICRAILGHDEFTEVCAKEEPAGSTALHLAADSGRAEICRAILAHRCFVDVNVEDNYGRTAMRLATMLGRADVASVIRSGGGREEGLEGRCKLQRAAQG